MSDRKKSTCNNEVKYMKRMNGDNMVKNLKEYGINIIFSIFVTFLVIIGPEIYHKHSIDNIINYQLKYIGIFVGIFIIFCLIFEMIKRLFLKLENRNHNSQRSTYLFSKRILVLMIVMLILVYGLCYISFFPGIFSYDMPTQDKMAKGILPLSNHHPVLHTLIWKFFLSIKNVIHIKHIEIIGYSIFQLMVVISTYLILIRWQIRNNYSKKFIIMTYLYFLLNPLLHVFSFNPTKDVLFACFLLLFLMSIIDVLKCKNKWNYFKVVTFSLLLCLFRNNVIYAVMVLERQKNMFSIIKCYFIIFCNN